MKIQQRNEELKQKIAVIHEEFTKEEERKFMGDSKIYAYGYWSYLRGLRDRGIDILAEMQKEMET